MIILRLLLLLTNLHLKLLSTQGTGADKLLSTQRVNVVRVAVLTYDLVICKDSNDCLILLYISCLSHVSKQSDQC